MRILVENKVVKQSLFIRSFVVFISSGEVLEGLDLYEQESLTLPANFREASLKISVNKQGTPNQNYCRDSNYTDNIDNLPSLPP